MEDLLLMYGLQGQKETFEIEAHLRYLHVAVVLAEVAMLKIWQNSHNLVKMAEGGDQRTY